MRRRHGHVHGQHISLHDNAHGTVVISRFPQVHPRKSCRIQQGDINPHDTQQYSLHHPRTSRNPRRPPHAKSKLLRNQPFNGTIISPPEHKTSLQPLALTCPPSRIQRVGTETAIRRIFVVSGPWLRSGFGVCDRIMSIIYHPTVFINFLL